MYTAVEDSTLEFTRVTPLELSGGCGLRCQRKCQLWGMTEGGVGTQSKASDKWPTPDLQVGRAPGRGGSAAKWRTPHCLEAAAGVATAAACRERGPRRAAFHIFQEKPETMYLGAIS